MPRDKRKQTRQQTRQQTRLTVSPAFYARVRECAERDGVSMSSVVERALAMALELNEPVP